MSFGCMKANVGPGSDTLNVKKEEGGCRGRGAARGDAGRPN